MIRSAGYDLEWRGRLPRAVSPTTLAREGLSGASWYRDATPRIVEYSEARGLDPAYVAGVLAVTSPRVTVTRNVQLTDQYLSTGSVDGMLPGVKVALEHFEKTGVIRGLKTEAFSRALLGDPDAVVIDSWMVRAFRWDWRSITRKRYASGAASVRRIATRLGLSPAECQAAIWTGVRGRFGHNQTEVIFLTTDR